jgi:hypothetical protein
MQVSVCCIGAGRASIRGGLRQSLALLGCIAQSRPVCVEINCPVSRIPMDSPSSGARLGAGPVRREQSFTGKTRRCWVANSPLMLIARVIFHKRPPSDDRRQDPHCATRPAVIH